MWRQVDTGRKTRKVVELLEEKACWELVDDRSIIMQDRYVFIVELEADLARYILMEGPG